MIPGTGLHFSSYRNAMAGYKHTESSYMLLHDFFLDLKKLNTEISRE